MGKHRPSEPCKWGENNLTQCIPKTNLQNFGCNKVQNTTSNKYSQTISLETDAHHYSFLTPFSLLKSKS